MSAINPKKQKHLYALLESKSKLNGIAIYDRLDTNLESSINLIQTMLRNHQLVQFLDKEDIDNEIIEKLDAIIDIANRANQG